MQMACHKTAAAAGRVRRDAPFICRGGRGRFAAGTGGGTMAAMAGRSLSTIRDRLVWDQPGLVSPHAQEDKSQRIRQMFDAIAPTYELINALASGGRDAYWRREMVRLAK